MSRKNINFEDDFYKNKNVTKIDDTVLIKYKSLKKNHMTQKILLNTLLDTMIMILLDHYA